MKLLFHIDAPTMRGAPNIGLVIENGVVVEAAPYAHWAVGKDVWVVVDWFESKGGKVIDITPIEESRESIVGDARVL